MTIEDTETLLNAFCIEQWGLTLDEMGILLDKAPPKLKRAKKLFENTFN